MKFKTITIFPEIFEGLESYGILAKAMEKGLISIESYNLRDYSQDKHKKVDDIIYGGGPGMLMRPEPLHRAITTIGADSSKVILMSPQGRVLDNSLAQDLAKEEDLTIVCGHYEGVDQRIIDNFIDLEVSIGDYVVTGGELPAMVLIDCVSRFIPGIVGNEDSVIEDSHYDGLLKYPSYTRPREFLSYKVPDVLLSGDHEKIRKWREEKSLENTKIKRPDLIDKLED